MFAFYTDRYDSMALESFAYFGLTDPMVAMEGFNVQSVIGLLMSLVEKIKRLVTGLIAYAKRVKEWFRLKMISLLKLKYVDLPAGQYKLFKIATDGLMDLVRTIAYILPQLVSTKVRLFGKIGTAIKTKAKGPRFKMVGDILSQANTIADTLDKVAVDMAAFNLQTKNEAFLRFKMYQPTPGEKMIRVPTAQLKFYRSLNDKANEFFTIVTESFQDVQKGITEFIDTMRKDENGEGLLDGDEADKILASVTKLPMLFGKASNQMVAMTSQAMVMINIMLAYSQQEEAPATSSTALVASSKSTQVRMA